MSSNRSLIVAMVAVVVAGCSTNTVRLDYTAGNIEAAEYIDVRPIDSVIVFDHRSNDPHSLGAIRGGFGNALKTLTTEEAVSEVVQGAFESALQARGIPSEGVDPFTMRINLVRLDCSQYVRREAHANVAVMLEGSDGETEWTESFQSDVIQGSLFALDAGIFGDVEDLRKVALQALNEVVNQAFNDPGFIDTLKRPTSAAAGAASAPAVAVSKPKQESKHYTTADGKAVAETLAALKVLHGQGVLSDEEYMRKQREVINEHTRKTQESLAGYVPVTTAEANLPQKVSPSGATAAATVTALGVTNEKEVSESIPPIAVAVFPFATRGGFIVTNDADQLLPEFAHQYISENSQLRMLASYFKDTDSKIGGQTDYWSTTSQPLASRIYSDGARIDADAVLMYSYSGRYTMEDRFDVTVYLFDVKNRRAYQSSGNQNNYKRVTESLFKKITAIQ